MRDPWISNDDALRERLSDPGQSAPDAPTTDLPPYALSFLAHLRLLVGVPFEYLVPDPLMLPNESIRFFHLDRSWTDRLVDGVFAVGTIGTREQAHYQTAAPDLQSRLDTLQPSVRPMQRGLGSLEPTATSPDPAGAITGVLLRSALVSGWPQMDVRAYTQGNKLTLLRLERLAPAVLIALFAGIPDRVELEEPHHGVQFGSSTIGGTLGVLRRRPDGQLSPSTDTQAPIESGAAEQPSFPFAFRDPQLQVVEIAALRRLLSYEADERDAPRPSPTGSGLIGMPVQTGSAAFTVELLVPPWRQVYADDAVAASGSAPTEVSAHGTAVGGPPPGAAP
jgi:hypothetical protein